MCKLRVIILSLGIILVLTSCTTVPFDKQYYNIELYMTYSEVVKLIGEPDEIVETDPHMPWNVTYYEWNLKDGNTLQIRLEYPGTYSNRERSPKNPDDFVVGHCIIINESLVPTTQPSINPTA